MGDNVNGTVGLEIATGVICNKTSNSVEEKV